MRITIDMIGKKVIRTGANKRDDRSFTSEGRVLVNVTEFHFYTRPKHSSEPYAITREEWDDDKWALYEPEPTKCICKKCPNCGGVI